MTEIPRNSSDMAEVSAEGLTDLRDRLAQALILFGDYSDNIGVTWADGMALDPKWFTYDVGRETDDARRLHQTIKELLFTPDELDKIAITRIQAGYETPRIIDEQDPILHGHCVYITIDAVMQRVGVEINKYISIEPSPYTQQIEGIIDATYSRGTRIGLGRTDFSGEDLTDPEVVMAVIDSVTENKRPLGIAESEVIERVIAHILKNTLRAH